MEPCCLQGTTRAVATTSGTGGNSGASSAVPRQSCRSPVKHRRLPPSPDSHRARACDLLGPDMRHDINVLTPPITDDLRLASSRVLLNPAADGRRVIVLANREPLSHEWDAEGRIETKVSTSGLVTASEPLVRESGGVWVAHGSGSADRAVVDRWDGVMIPAEDPAYRLRRVWLEPAEQAGYYYGFANDGLWPLCHRVHVRPEFRSADFDMYWT